ncbi:MAG TPA: hypothetical protein VEX37_05945, partial [Thermomicrobiales bacterium]|nr:hypothetical protein [Thermomicrobiales bacterium]
MRGLFAQFMLPAMLLLGGTIAGIISGSPAWGVVTGFALSALSAGWLVRHALRRLTKIERTARLEAGDDIESYAAIDDRDQIDHALRTVAQAAVNAERRRRDRTLLLTQ